MWLVAILRPKADDHGFLKQKRRASLLCLLVQIITDHTYICYTTLLLYYIGKPWYVALEISFQIDVLLVVGYRFRRCLWFRFPLLCLLHSNLFHFISFYFFKTSSLHFTSLHSLLHFIYKYYVETIFITRT